MLTLKTKTLLTLAKYLLTMVPKTLLTLPRKTQLSLALAVIYFTHPLWTSVGQTTFSHVKQPFIVAWDEQVACLFEDGSVARSVLSFADRTADESFSWSLPVISTGAAPANMEMAIFSVVHRMGRADQWSKTAKAEGPRNVVREDVWE